MVEAEPEAAPFHQQLQMLQGVFTGIAMQQMQNLAGRRGNPLRPVMKRLDVAAQFQETLLQ